MLQLSAQIRMFEPDLLISENSNRHDMIYRDEF